MKRVVSSAFFYIMWSVVGVVSVLDLFLALWFLDPSHMPTLKAQEKNPIVIKLIELSGDMSFFTTCKILGTLASLWIVRKIYQKNKKWGLSVVFGMFIFQTCLLYYLLFGTG